jgi:hypothetical protein
MSHFPLQRRLTSNKKLNKTETVAITLADSLTDVFPGNPDKKSVSSAMD